MVAPTNHSNGNGNGYKSPLQRRTQRIALESAGFTVAEGASMFTSLGVVAVADVLAPGVLRDASKFVSKHLIEPNLDAIERGIGKVCKLEECKSDEHLTREERSQQLARTLLLFSASWAAGMAAKLGTRRGLNRAFGVEAVPNKRKEFIILAADEVVHYGSLITANMLMPGMTDEFIRTTTDVLEKCGVPKRKAKELSAYCMMWEMPNLLGLLSGLGAVYATHTYPEKFGLKP